MLEFLGRYWWALVPLPPLVWLACFPWPAAGSAAGAIRSTPAPWRRLGDSAGRHGATKKRPGGIISPTGLRLAPSIDRRHRRGSASRPKGRRQLVAETRRRFAERDAADYGRRPGCRRLAFDPQVWCDGCTRPPSRCCWRAVCLVPLCTECGGRVPTSCSPGPRMRGEKPDEVQPLFVEAALALESAGRFLNAGNGWFFAGENGRRWPITCSAQRRWPFDRSVARKHRIPARTAADAFPPPARPRAGWPLLEAVLHVGDGVASGFVCAGISGSRGWSSWRRRLWGVADLPRGLGCVGGDGARAVGVGGSNQFPAGGRSCRRGRRRPARPWLRLRSRIPATAAQG